jgi:mannose-6-phosphate isomerase-like protein (cupin superfamily)
LIVKLLTMLLSFGALALSSGLEAQSKGPQYVPLADRIAHTDTAKYRDLSAVHGGAGSMKLVQLLGNDALSTNFIFLHRGVISPRSGVGEHFHNQSEEMFIILDGEAEFTVNGRTSKIRGPAGVPNRMGSAHAIYNPTNEPLQWLNINVGMTKRYDAFDLGDDRVQASLDPIPQFISFQLDKSLLKLVEVMNGGTGTVKFRRALEPTVFSTPWAYVDHLVVPSGASVGPTSDGAISEVYYVISGDGSVTVGPETASIKTGDAIAVDINQVRSIRGGNAALEVLVIGVARDLGTKEAWQEAQASARLEMRR